jgi:glycine cleavage system transcriptional repressor
MRAMLTNFVLTLTGPDRIGIVDEVTGLLFRRGGNVENSRMARLGGEFAVLMLVSMPTEEFARLSEGLESLMTQGYKITTTEAGRPDAVSHPGWLPQRIEVQGADHEGIIHEVAHYLSELGITIESAESESTPAPTSGAPLFSMTARVLIPPALAESDWKAGLDAIGTRLNLDITATPTRGR